MSGQQQATFDHPNTAAQADTEAMSLLQEASKAFRDGTFQLDIESKLKSMTPVEQTLMASAFQRIERNPATYSTGCPALPEVDLIDINNELDSIAFSGNCDDKSFSFKLTVNGEPEASKQKRYAEGAAEVAKMLQGNDVSNAVNRMVADAGHMSTSDWLSFMMQVSKLAPNQLKLLTPSDFSHLPPDERKHFAQRAGMPEDQLKDDFLFTTTQPRLFGLLGANVNLIAVGLTDHDRDITKAGWTYTAGEFLYQGEVPVESDYDSSGLPKWP